MNDAPPPSEAGAVPPPPGSAPDGKPPLLEELRAWLEMPELTQQQADKWVALAASMGLAAATVAHAHTSQLSELSFWGFARYSHSLRRPFRAIKDEAAVLYFAASEVAQRAAGLQPEVVACFLCERLREMGQDFTQQQTLAQWIDECNRVLPPGVVLPEIVRVRERSAGFSIHAELNDPGFTQLMDRGSFAELLVAALLKQQDKPLAPPEATKAGAAP